MTTFSALVSLIAAALTIALRIRELRRHTDPDSLKATIHTLVGPDGFPLARAPSQSPGMLIPALMFILFLEVTAISAVIAPSIVLALNEQLPADVDPEQAQNIITNTLSQAAGYIVTSSSFPVFVLLAYKRSFLNPARCFNRATVMGIWSGTILGSLESMLSGLRDPEEYNLLHLFLVKFTIFFGFGMLSGLLFLLIRRLSRMPTVGRLMPSS